MIEGNEEFGNLEGAANVAAAQNPDQDEINNLQIQVHHEGVDEPPQAPDVEENPFLNALAIHLIAKKIYDYLDIESLKTCLYVHRDLHEDLRVIIAWRRHIQFTNFENDENSESLRDCLDSLESLPRSRYTFTNYKGYFAKHLDNEDLQEFFRRLGSNIRELCLKFPKDASHWCCQAIQDLKETEAMELIKTLVTSQAIFMQKLSLNVFCSIKWNEPPSASARPLRKSDPELASIHAQGIASVKSQSLRKLEILGNISSKIIELIICLAPNLEEVKVPELNYEYIIEPVNRIQLLKSVTVFRANVDTLERLLELNAENIKLKEIKLQLWESEDRNEEIKRRQVSITNNLFGSSWESLEFLHWDGVARLQQLVWPVCFPKVSHIKIGNPLEGSNLIGHIFPENFNFCRVFPALKKLSMYHHANLNNLINFVTFLNCLNLEPVGTVSTVDVRSWQASDQGLIRESLQTVFPNVKEIIFHR